MKKECKYKTKVENLEKIKQWKKKAIKIELDRF